MRATRILWIVATALCLFGAASSGAATAPAVPLNIVNVYLKTNQVRIRALENVQVQIRLKDTRERLRAYTEQSMSAAGLQTIELRTASGHPAIIQPGDSIAITPEGEEPVVITTVYLDARPVAQTDIIFLEGPPNTELRVQVQAPEDLFPQHLTALTNAEGLATLDLAETIDLRPGVSGFAAYEPAAGRAVVVPFQIPTVVAKVGSDWIEGVAWAGREVSLTLEDDAGHPMATTRLLAGGEQCFSTSQTGEFPRAGCFSTRLAEQFAGLRIAPDQTIRVVWENQQIVLNVPELSIRADPARDQITGRAPAGANLSVTLYDQTTGRRRWYQTMADQNGHYQVDLNGRVDINANDDGAVVYQTPEGHKLVAEFRVPFIELEAGSHRVSGRGVENARVVADLQASDGTTKATAQTTVDTRGNFALELEADDGQPAPVTAGDTVQVTIDGEPITIDVPALTVHLDPDQDRVTGQGPPGEPLQISLVAGDARLTEDVTPDANGTYSLDVRGQANIRAGATATAVYTTAGEHQIRTQDHLTQIIAQAGANYIQGLTAPDTVVDVFVRDTGGQLKDWARTTADPRGRFSVGLVADCQVPVPLAPGDEIVVRVGAGEIDALEPSNQVSLTIPNLTATLDPESDQVIGTGPAGATITVHLSAADGSRRDEITTGDDGRYSLAYAPDIDVRPGDHVTVSFVNPEGHYAFVQSNVPAFSTTIGDAVLRGSVAPFHTLRATLFGDEGAPKAEAVAASNHNGAFTLVFRGDENQSVPIEAGDVLEIETAGTTYRLQVPPLSLELDPAGPTITGITVPGATINFMFITQSRFYLQHTVTAGADGRYVAAFDPDIAIRAGDWASARISASEALEVGAHWSAPQLTAHVGTNYAEVDMSSRTPVTVTLRSSAGTLRATDSVDPINDDGAYFYTSDERPVVIQPGDRIDLAQASSDLLRASAAHRQIRPQAQVGEATSMTVPDLTVDWVPESSLVHGSGPAGGKVFVTATGTGGEDSRNASVPVWADGTYEIRFAGLDLGPGASASVAYTDPETGHRTVHETYRGWLRAHIDDNVVEVRAEPLSDVTVRLRDAEGALKGAAGPIQVDHQGSATLRIADGETDRPQSVAAGDHLELASPDGVTELFIPPVSLGIDIAGNQVIGTVPGQGTTSVTLSTSDGCTYSREIRPAPDGHFQADFAYDVEFGPGDRVTLRYTTAAGHELEIQRTVRTVHLPLIHAN